MRVKSCRIAFVLSYVVGLSLAAGAQGKRPMTMIDLLDVPQVAEPRLSPDGKQVLFTVAKSDWKADRRVPHIWRVNTDGSGLVQMTNGLTGESSPRWSPDGTRFAFAARRTSGADSGAGRSEVSQVFLQNNAAGEALQLTKHETAVSGITWSPSDDCIYFLAADPKTPDEKEKDRLRDDVFAFDDNNKQSNLCMVALAV